MGIQIWRGKQPQAHQKRHNIEVVAAFQRRVREQRRQLHRHPRRNIAQDLESRHVCMHGWALGRLGDQVAEDGAHGLHSRLSPCSGLRQLPRYLQLAEGRHNIVVPRERAKRRRGGARSSGGLQQSLQGADEHVDSRSVAVVRLLCGERGRHTSRKRDSDTVEGRRDGAVGAQSTARVTASATWACERGSVATTHASRASRRSDSRSRGRLRRAVAAKRLVHSQLIGLKTAELRAQRLR
mmetsp:Transcript_49920/g.120224  ORF Transcript_49920/g.120224 Transcript_49920/m.120224 type:complete len:239 (-) Transcript_49920:35-751(-)